MLTALVLNPEEPCYYRGALGGSVSATVSQRSALGSLTERAIGDNGAAGIPWQESCPAASPTSLNLGEPPHFEEGGGIIPPYSR